uniref:Signal transducing adaptor family member 1 n=1 Tax=Pelodiscus sinensis TaxID=13735 RepID=K7F4J2_PELSI
RMAEPGKIPEPAPRRIFQERQRITALPLYFEGFLSIRCTRYQDFQQYWTELRGTTLFFYMDKKTPAYTKKLELVNLTSIANVYPDERRGGARFLLMLPNEDVELKVEDYDNREEWKSFILTVTQLAVPACISLLPGQLIRLNEVLEKEKKRRTAMKQPPSASLSQETSNNGDYMNTLKNGLTQCFYAVSRQEAIEMLEKDPSWGNLILRPGSDSKNFSVTIRQDIDGPCIKHYRVVNTGKGYTIELARSVTLLSLRDVIDYFLKETRGSLMPFVSHTYDN